MMNKPQKIVIIEVCKPANLPYWHPKPDEDLYYLASWGGAWAKRLKKRYSDFAIEVWSSDKRFNNITYRKACGVDCLIFPARHYIIKNLVTSQMLRKLKDYASKYNLIIHRQTIFDWKFNLILPLLLSHAKYMLSHHGGVFPSNNDIKSRLKRLILRYSYKNIHAATYLRNFARKELIASNKKMLVDFLPVGADFEMFKPMNKRESRNKLGLPIEKIFAVYVGQFYKLKSVDLILKVFHQLKNKNFEVLFVGGREENELYQEVVRSGCRHWDYVDQNLLREIIGASDFYIHPLFHDDFGGFDVALIEALACNRPVLSTQFAELDFDCSALGKQINDPEMLVIMTEEMMNTFQNYRQCREVAQKHLDANVTIIDQLYASYSTL